MLVKRIIWISIAVLIPPIWFWVGGFEFERGPSAFLLFYLSLAALLLTWFLPTWED